MTFTPGITGLLVIGPYNDFISEGGKVYDRLKGVAEANNCIPAHRPPHRAHLRRGDRRYGAELGYQVSVVKDATTSYSDDHMHAALRVNLPNYAAVVTTDEIIDAIRSAQ